MVQILRDIHPVSRKEHKCMFCGGTIKVGQKYDRQTNVYDGQIYDWITHEECSTIAHKLDMYDDCDDNGLDDESFLECIKQYVYDNHYDDSIDDIAKDWQLPYYDIVKQILEELSKESNG
ncbi:hypothetical protein [uncultured Parabacteroides sp.]|uniref:hypothetical protein n=1 Tax=uncultured Parabacteroides sp. TaxID=512312 RepID=UPI0026306B80|nr:hypothetical protein [uncultured Parabacteroides sp.]